MRYYPVEMIAAMLNSVKDSSEKVAYYIKFAEEKGIQVLQEQGIDVFQLINDNNLGDSAAKVTQAIINL